MKTYHDIATDGGSDVVGQVGQQRERLRGRLATIDHVVAVTSGKGGVGKSMVTVLLATEAARMGVRVGILDADLNGTSLVRMTGVDREPARVPEGVQPAVSRDGVRVMSVDLFLEDTEPVRWKTTAEGPSHSWRGLVEMGALREMIADTLWGDLELLLIDLPPGSDKLPGLVELIDELDAAVIVSIPSGLSSYVVRKSIENVQDVMKNRHVALIRNMDGFVCPNCDERHELFPSDDASLEGLDSLVPIGSIPFDPEIGRRIDAGTAAPDSSSPAVAAVRKAAERLSDLLGLALHSSTEPPALAGFRP